MAGVLDSLMSGYTERVLGPDSGAAKNNAALQTATAYQNLQDAIAADYGQQKQQFESDPTNKGKSWQAPDTSERFQDQVHAMILSGDPALQQRALGLIDQPKDEASTTLEKTAKLLNLTPMQVFQMQHPGPSSTNVSVNLPKMDQPMTLEDLQKLQMPNGQQPLPGMTMREAGQAGATVAQTKDQAETAGATNAMNRSLTGMEQNQGVTSTPLPGAVAEARNYPGVVGQAINTGLNAAGFPQNQNDVKFLSDRAMYVGQLTKAMNGAGASDQERENWMKQAPNLTDDPSTRRIKLNNLREATRSFTQAAKSKGSSNINTPEAPKAPQATKRFNPATGKIEAIQ